MVGRLSFNDGSPRHDDHANRLAMRNRLADIPCKCLLHGRYNHPRSYRLERQHLCIRELARYPLDHRHHCLIHPFQYSTGKSSAADRRYCGDCTYLGNLWHNCITGDHGAEIDRKGGTLDLHQQLRLEFYWTIVND